MAHRLNRRAALRQAAVTGLALAASSCSLPRPAGTPPLIKLGLVLPFSGLYEPHSFNIIFAVRQAIREANARGGVAGHMVELVAVDDRNTAEQAAQRASELALDGDVLAVLGHFDGRTTLAAERAYSLAGLQLVNPFATADQITGAAHPNVFRLTTRAGEIGKAAARLLSQNGGATAVIGDGSLESDDTQAGFRSVAGASQLTVVMRVAVRVGQLDFATIARQLLEAHPNTVCFTGHAPEGGLLLSALRSAGFGGRWIGGSMLDDPNFVRAAAGKADSALYVTTAPLAKDVPAAATFSAAFRSTTGQDPGTNALQAYDATRLLMRALERTITADGRPTRAGVREALIAAAPFPGLLGALQFDSNHELTAQRTYVFEVQSGTYPGKPLTMGLQ